MQLCLGKVQRLTDFLITFTRYFKLISVMILVKQLGQKAGSTGLLWCGWVKIRVNKNKNRFGNFWITGGTAEV